MLKLARLLTPFCIAAGLSGPLHADTIRSASALGPSHLFATTTYPTLFARLESFTDGRWTGRDTPSGLVTLGEMNSALRDGVAQMGPVILPYYAADYPESSLPISLAMVGRDNRAISAAVTEYIVTCAECLAEFRANGQVFLGTDASAPMNLLSTKPIRTLDDLAGLRVRTGAAIFARTVEGLGGIPVQMSGGEMFEALTQGVLDASFSTTPDLDYLRLADAVGYVTEIEAGSYNVMAVVNASALLWEDMAPADRAALARAAQHALVAGLEVWRADAAASRVSGLADGIEFITPSEDLVAAFNVFVDQHLQTVAGTLEKRGVTNADVKVARYQALVEKWETLIANAESPDAMAELRYSEIWSSLDYASFGF